MQALSLDQLVGQVLGNYRIERFLGKGRLNAVYLARNLASQRLDALTMYLVPSRFSVEANTRFLARFRKESAAITKLDHPHILPVYEHGEYAGTPYLVTPYATQGSLADLLKRSGRYDHTMVVPILEQVASGVAYAHDNGYIHGMLRPSNIVVRDQELLQVAGFGLMHMLQLGGIEESGQPYAHLLTVGQTFLASPEYIAPEVVEGQAVDVRSDIYALGCILFELLCGRPPFIGSDPLEVATQHVNQDIPSLRALYSEVPIALVSVVNQALSRDPAKRFQHVEELKEAYIQVSRGAAPKSVPNGHTSQEGQNRSESGQRSELLQETPPHGYRMSSTGKWQLLPPIITGKLPALAKHLPPPLDPQVSPIHDAAITLPPLVPPPALAGSDIPTIAPEGQSAYSASVKPSHLVDGEGGDPFLPTNAAIPVPPQSARRTAKGKNTQSGKNEELPELGMDSLPGVYEDSNKLAQSYSWWSQPGTEEGDSSLPYNEKREEPVKNAQPAKKTTTREPLRVATSDNWITEPVVPPDVKRNFGTAAKSDGKKSRRSVVAFLAAGGGIVAAGATTGIALNLGYFEHLLGLTNHAPTARTNTNNTNSVTQPKTQATQPPKTQSTPTAAKAQNKAGPVIGNTQQKANSAVTFINTATDTPGILVRLADGTFKAYDKACTHVGVLVNYDPATKRLVCPAHGAVFDPANGGAVIQGPAQRPLPTIGIQVQADGTVTIV